MEHEPGDSDKSSDEESHTCSTEEAEEDQEDESQSGRPSLSKICFE